MPNDYQVAGAVANAIASNASTPGNPNNTWPSTMRTTAAMMQNQQPINLMMVMGFMLAS